MNRIPDDLRRENFTIGQEDEEDPTEVHKCSRRLPHSAWGPAIEQCESDEQGRFWVDNFEYASQVNYCPFCGAKAPVPVTES